MKDLFGDDAPSPTPKKPAAKRPPAAPAPPPAPPPPVPEAPRARRVSATRSGEAAVEGEAKEKSSRRHLPCEGQPWRDGMAGQKCSWGPGLGTCSRDGGRTWYCGVHIDPQFWPKNRT